MWLPFQTGDRFQEEDELSTFRCPLRLMLKPSVGPQHLWPFYWRKSQGAALWVFQFAALRFTLIQRSLTVNWRGKLPKGNANDKKHATVFMWCSLFNSVYVQWKVKVSNKFKNNKVISANCTAVWEIDQLPPVHHGRNNKHLSLLHIYASLVVGAVTKLLEAVFFLFFFLSESDRSKEILSHGN